MIGDRYVHRLRPGSLGSARDGEEGEQVMKPKRCCGTCKHWPNDKRLGASRRCEKLTTLWRTAEHGERCRAWSPSRPASKPAPFRRWTLEKYAGAFIRIKFDGVEPKDYEVIVRALNRARIVLPKVKP